MNESHGIFSQVSHWSGVLSRKSQPIYPLRENFKQLFAQAMSISYLEQQKELLAQEDVLDAQINQIKDAS